MKRAKNRTWKLAGGNAEAYDDYCSMFASTMAALDECHSEGASTAKAQLPMLPYLEYVAMHDALGYKDDGLPLELHMEFVKLLYKAYCDGYRSVG